MAAEGLESGFFELEKWGIPDYDELVFICGAKTLAKKKKAVNGFVRAVARGIDAVAASPDAALADYFRAVPDADRAVETAAFGLTRPYYATGQVCDPKRWQAFADFALKHGLIEKPVAVAPCCRTSIRIKASARTGPRAKKDQSKEIHQCAKYEQIDAAGNEAAFANLFGKKATISASFKSYRVDRNKTRYDSK
jgi:hypothetical protein